MKSLLVTVGSTHFEELIEVVDTPAFVQLLAEKGYKRLVVQYGPKAIYIPNKVGILCKDFGIECDIFSLSSEFAKIVDSASLIISHAGTPPKKNTIHNLFHPPL